MLSVHAARRRWLVGLVAVALLVMPLGPVGQARAADASLVVAALHVLEDEYVDPVHPVPLLNAAITTIRKVSTLGAGALPDIPSDATPEAAESAFTSEFARAAQAGPLPETRLAYVATEGMLASLNDTHTNFLDPKAYVESRQQIMGRPGFTGIGVVITSRKDPSGDSWIFIEDVFPGSPADGGGLKRFDRIVEVDGKSLKNANSVDASQLIRGPAGSTAVLTIRRGDQILNMSVIRAPIKEPPVEAKFIQPGVLYVKLFGFTQGSGRQLRSVLEGLAAQESVRSVILDLRGNLGGLVHEAVAVGGLFLPPRTVLAKIQERGQPASTLRTTSYPLLPRTPVILLTDNLSASASEIIIGAFKDYHRANIVGEKTAGALGGSVTVTLPEGTGMSVTVERILTPNGSVVEGVGITPDTEVSLTVADMERGDDTQLQAALRAVGAVRPSRQAAAA